MEATQIAKQGITSPFSVVLDQIVTGFSFFYWAARIQKLCPTKPPLPRCHFRSTSEAEKNKPSLSSSSGGAAAGQLKRDDVKLIMEKLGIWSDQVEKMEEDVDLEQLDSMFEKDAPSMDELEEAFLVFDRNGDGFIDVEELQRVLSNLGFDRKLSSSVVACRKMIDAYDQNRDGKIDFHEFLKFMEES